MHIRNLIYILIFAILTGIVSFSKPVNKNVVSLNSLEIINDTIVESPLTEWQIFIIALIEVECERNPNVKSSKNAIGPLQITPIYVEEVNRIYNTNYKFEDAWDLNKSLEMFELTNDYYNPNRDIDKAIQIHNPGAGKWYSDRIKQRMKMVRFSEEVRTELKDNTK